MPILVLGLKTKEIARISLESEQDRASVKEETANCGRGCG